MAILILSGAFWGWRHFRAGLCEGSESRLEGIWSEGSKRTIERRFLATGKTYARDVWVRTGKAMDGYTEAWVGMHREACEATRLRGEQSEKVLDLRMGCLRRRLKEFEALSRVFAQADEEVIAKAIQALQGLTPVSHCANVDLLAANPGLSHFSADPARQRRIEQGRDKLSEIEVLWRTGRSRQAMEPILSLRRSAQEIGYPPLEVEVFYWQGRIQEENGDIPAATESLEDALWMAQASDHKEMIARSAIRLLGLTAYRQGLQKQAFRWGRVGDALLASLEGSVALKGDLENGWGEYYLAQGDFGKSAAHHRRALEIRRAALGERHTDVAWSWNNLASVLLGGFLALSGPSSSR